MGRKDVAAQRLLPTLPTKKVSFQVRNSCFESAPGEHPQLLKETMNPIDSGSHEDGGCVGRAPSGGRTLNLLHDLDTGRQESAEPESPGLLSRSLSSTSGIERVASCVVRIALTGGPSVTIDIVYLVPALRSPNLAFLAPA